ncbi:tyrosine protein phosphatase yvh1 [Pseudogymnoascus destructans]|uniref:protein-tyrosine-phosphatase n=2 Tax=Pseudogymnoascus destructans TaxID=655981 RepID=L8G5Y1_PSED2|nr:tyrosine protein phosphatase yvh1 [Pseudogymnoascus destructans]ELR08640.1 hypothetical protein GMDG_03327 [Pseudogymnoascus destructans 20631-21]OAF59519.1 tyrosine protein phosphatase yvh1 [Pseudogymnoascus destructans]
MKGIGDVELANVREKQRLEEVNKAMEMSIAKVPGDEKIYVSGVFALRRPQTLKEAGITHIVSALRFNYKETKGWENYTHCNVQIDDMDDENLIEHFPTVVQFIKDALAGGGGVLIHCAMGKSRSVTLAIAYLLATRPSLTPYTALSLIRQTRPHADPNSGFMTQLDLWRRCGCTPDLESSPIYQRWLYAAEVELSTAIGRAPDRLRFEDEEKVKAGVTESSDATKAMRCRRCRTLLAKDEYIVEHDPKAPKEEDSISSTVALPLPNPDAAAASSSSVACGHFFLQALSWMRLALETGELEGRLPCPNLKCEALVGRWNWKGLKCSCGVWVTPAFAVQKGRVDLLSPAVERGRGAQAAGVRMPPGMRVPPPRGGNL